MPGHDPTPRSMWATQIGVNGLLNKQREKEDMKSSGRKGGRGWIWEELRGTVCAQGEDN